MAIFGARPETTESTPTPSMRPSAPPVGQVNMIGQGALIEGTVQIKGDIRIGGKVVGEVEVDGKLITTDEGQIEGDVVATNADVAGSVRGSLVVKERLILRSTSSVQGDIRTPKMVIEDGAVFTGKVDMTTKAVPSGAQKPLEAPKINKPAGGGESGPGNGSTVKSIP